MRLRRVSFLGRFPAPPLPYDVLHPTTHRLRRALSPRLRPVLLRPLHARTQGVRFRVELRHFPVTYEPSEILAAGQPGNRPEGWFAFWRETFKRLHVFG